MKKLILILLLSMTISAFASDRAGRPNVTTGGDMLTQLFKEVFPNYNQPQKSLDTTTAFNFLNSSTLNASKVLKCVERDTVILMIADTEWYNLPSDFYEIPADMSEFGVVAIGKGTGFEIGMKLMSIFQIGAERPTASSDEIPTNYLIRKYQIHVEPANNSNDSVRVYYAAYSNVLDSVQDTTNIDKQYIDYVILLAAEKFLRGANWGNMQSYANSRLLVVQANLAEEEKRLGITRRSIVEDMVR